MGLPTASILEGSCLWVGGIVSIASPPQSSPPGTCHVASGELQYLPSGVVGGHVDRSKLTTSDAVKCLQQAAHGIWSLATIITYFEKLSILLKNHVLIYWT